MIIVQGAFTISPIHDRPLQIGLRMEEEQEEEEVVEEEEGEEEQGRGGVFDKYIFRPPALWWFTQPLVLGFRVGAFI